MGKYTEADRHINCHACGYKSCYDMARTVFYGNNSPENCIVHEKHILTEMASKIESQNGRLSDVGGNIHRSMQMLSDKIMPIHQQTEDNSVKNDTIKSDMSTLDTDISGILSHANDIAQFVNQISISIGEYERILDKIKGISEQTNILAINASIGAAGAVKSAETVKAAEQHTNTILDNISEIKSCSEKIMSDVDGTKENVNSTDRAVDDLNESLKFISQSILEITGIIHRVTDLASSLENS